MTYTEFKQSEERYYQPVYYEYCGFGDDPDYQDIRYEDVISTDPQKAMEYGKKHCPEGYGVRLKTLKIMR